MKINNETKVGILAIVALTILILGFNFLKGQTLFSKADALYAVFPNAGSLSKSNEVKINGLPVGKVYELRAFDKEVNGVLVTIHLTEDVNIPKNSIALVESPLVGTSFIAISKGDSKQYMEPGDTISTNVQLGIMDDLRTQLSPTMARVNNAVDTLTLVLGSINRVFDPRLNNNLQTMIANLALSSHHLQRMLNTETGALSRTLGNVEAVTGNLARNNDAINTTLSNLQSTSGKLNNARITETIAALESTVNELKSAVSSINSNDGTLGKLMKDKQLYDNLNYASLSLELLLDDVRVNPKRYVNLSLIGRKAKGDHLTSPTPKDTTRKTQ